MAKINPFRPNNPVNHGMFVGRLEEMQRLEGFLLQTLAKEPVHFMLTGERGIGKTSLLLYLTYQAEGVLKVDGRTVHFLVAPIDIDSGTTVLGLVRKIELAIRRKLDKAEPARKALNTIWEFVKRCEVAGAAIRDGNQTISDELLLDEFCYSLASTAARLGNSEFEATALSAAFDGILILIDEASTGSAQLGLGTVLKQVAERLQRNGCHNVCIGLAGLEDLRESLRKSHPSAPRVFQEVVLGRLSEAEASRVIDRCLEKGRELNETEVTITQKGRGQLVYLSEGYPHFIQQFGYSAYEQDADNSIDDDDVLEAAFKDTGALAAIGDRYYRDDFYKKIQDEGYRDVLRIMAGNLDGWVTRAQLKAKFSGSASSLDNALVALRKRRIIVAKEDQKGVYRLQQKGFAFWIRLQGTRKAQLRKGAASRAEFLEAEEKGSNQA